jgi:hypothetical protein
MKTYLVFLLLLTSNSYGRNLGQLSANPYNANSTSNPYGAGSRFNPNSVNSEFGLGNPINPSGVNNPYATGLTSPKLYDKQGNFHGNLNNNPYDPDSVSNPYGRYGSEFSTDSINNEYGIGSEFNAESPYNGYGSGLEIED